MVPRGRPPPKGFHRCTRGGATRAFTNSEGEVKLDEELAYEYINCRQHMSSTADLIGYWMWLKETHPEYYTRVAARVKEAHPDVVRVQQQLMRNS
jgi:hypothetical protein